jgi:hypothetical protein
MKAAAIRGILRNESACYAELIFFWRTNMANWNKEEIAGLVRNQLITSGYEADVPKGYVSKLCNENLRTGFYHDTKSPLCVCVLRHDKTQFEPKQRKVILDVLQREEFASYFLYPEESEGKNEIWANTKLGAFEGLGWEHAGLADWIVQMLTHLETTLGFLELT